MIRRSPTRIELKLEDLNDFDYIQKVDKKKGTALGVVSSAEAQKLIRQERIGLGFRPIRSSSNVGSTAAQAGTPPAAIGTGNNISSPGILHSTPTSVTNDVTPADMNITNNSTGLEGLNLNVSVVIPEEDVARANNSTMSLDDSL